MRVDEGVPCGEASSAKFEFLRRCERASCLYNANNTTDFKYITWWHFIYPKKNLISCTGTNDDERKKPEAHLTSFFLFLWKNSGFTMKLTWFSVLFICWWLQIACVDDAETLFIWRFFFLVIDNTRFLCNTIFYMRIFI